MDVCPRCGAALRPGDPAGLCPVCLLAAAIGSGFTSGEADDSIIRMWEPAERDRFGPYRILSVLGEGGMGSVYLAEQVEPIRRRVALKVIKLGMDTKQVLARFDRERQALARMEHSNIARILDAGASSSGRPFFVMDYIEGASITDYCDVHQSTTTERLELLLPVCRAVQHAHNRGIVHRDIKPSNVLIMVEDGKPVPKVIDFGIARALGTGNSGNTLCTQFGEMVGTPEYASPEQANLIADEISAATDVYSLGVLVYEILIGTVPFDGVLLRRAGFAEMLRIIREEEPPSLVERLSAAACAAEIAQRRGTDTATLRTLVNGELNWIVGKALEKSPQRRYASPAELAADIERYLKGEPVLAGPTGRTRRIRKRFASAITSTIVVCDVINGTGDLSFDSTVRQTVGLELQRSKEIKVLPQGRIAEVLSQMRRNSGTHLSAEIGREICQRTGSAAFIEISVSNTGSRYLLTLRARDCGGDLVHGEQSAVDTKPEVLEELRLLTKRLRAKSTASFAMLQKNAAPLDAATTSSVEALKSFTAARQRSYAGARSGEGLLLFQRAIELDPEFALAYAWLARAYADAGEQSLAMDYARRAYRLRSIASDKENFFITYNYDREVLRNLELCRQVCESWIEKYPHDVMPHGFLSGLTSKGTAQYEKAIEGGEKAIALDPDFPIGYQNIAEAYLSLDRPDAAEAALERAAQRKLPFTDHLPMKFFVAFLNRDRSGKEKARAGMAAASPFGLSEFIESLTAISEGRLQQSRQALVQAVSLARQAHLEERAALFEGAAAIREALYGYPEESLRHSLAARRFIQGRDVDFPPAFALALSGYSSAASPIVTRLEEQYPEDTCIRFTYSPVLRALLAIHECRPAEAIELLNVSKAYELAQTGVSLYVYYGAALYSTYVRGLAYRQLQKNREAAKEFQRMLDHPGLLLADPIGPAARLQLARALRDASDVERAKAIYQDFLNCWKNADPDIPIFQEAKAEFAGL